MTDSVFTEFDADNTGGGGNLLLMSPSGSGRSVTYNLDQMGNRMNVVDTGVTTTYTQTGAGLNQYSQVGTNGVSNDNEHELRSYQNISYTYINDERLSSVTGNSNSYQLAYDAQGRCVKRTLNNVVTYYIYDGEKPIVEYNSAGSVVGRNLYGKAIDEILMRIDAVYGTYYYQDDHEGSVTHLLSSAGAILERYRYDIFGGPSIEDGNGNSLTASAYNNRFMFTGREYRSQFGIYEYRARAYHPGLGRFTGEDPKGFDAGDYNLFRYCHNDPEDLTDPMGVETLTSAETDDRVGDRIVEVSQMIGHEIAEMYREDPVGFVIAAATMGRGPKNAALGKNASKAIQHYLHRYISPKTVKAVLNAAPKTNSGKYIDPHTGKPTNDPVLGHKEGHEFWRERDKAEAQGKTQKEFNKEQNDPSKYQVEDRKENQSHKWEMPRDQSKPDAPTVEPAKAPEPRQPDITPDNSQNQPGLQEGTFLKNG